MRFARNVAFGLFSVALMGFGNFAVADELDDVFGDAAGSSSTTTSTVTSTSTIAIEKPTFSVSFPCSEQHQSVRVRAHSCVLLLMRHFPTSSR